MSFRHFYRGTSLVQRWPNYKEPFSDFVVSPTSSFVAKGISFKTQALYVAVFVTRYLDLLYTEPVSLYNTFMKLFFIGSSCYILYLMKMRFR